MRSIPRHTDRAGHRNLSAVEGWSLVAKCLYVLISALLGLLLSTFIVYGSSVVKMTYEANRMITSAENLANAALGCGSDEGFSESSHRLVTSARKLRDELDTTKWSLVRDHSTVGADITAVRTMLNAVGNLAEGPFTDLMNLSQRLSGFSMEDKTVDVSALLEVPGIVDNAHTSIETEVEALNHVPEPSIAQVASLVAAGRNALQSVDELLSQYDDLVELIPQLLGADGQRTYLVAIYNNAELRSGGGMVGNVAPITVDAGKVTIGDFEVTSAYKYGTGPFDSQFPADHHGEPRFPARRRDAEEYVERPGRQSEHQRGGRHSDRSGGDAGADRCHRRRHIVGRPDAQRTKHRQILPVGPVCGLPGFRHAGPLYQ